MSDQLIYQKIPAIMAEIGAIGKNRRNDKQGYSFRGIDDMYNAFHGILVKHKVFTIPKVIESKTEIRESKSGGTLIQRFLIIEWTIYAAEDGSNVVATIPGEGMDSGDKATNKAMSASHKYLFVQVFVVPTESGDDSENDSLELKPTSTSSAKPPVSPPKPQPEPVIPSRSDTEVDEKVQRQLILEEMREVMTNGVFTEGDREAAHSDVAKAKTIRDLVVIKNSWRKELAKREAE